MPIKKSVDYYTSSVAILHLLNNITANDTIRNLSAINSGCFKKSYIALSQIYTFVLSAKKKKELEHTGEQR